MQHFGILVLYPSFNKLVAKKKEKKSILTKFKIAIIEIICISICVQIAIFPINLLLFGKISLTTVFSNIAVSFVICSIMLFGILLLFPIPIPIITTTIILIVEKLLDYLKLISNFFANIDMSHIYVVTPSVIFIIIYYISLFCIIIFLKISKRKDKRQLEKCIIARINMLKTKLWTKRIYIIVTILIFSLIYQIKLPQNLEIHFLDVGQGDTTFIITPNHKKILIDGGGSKKEEYNLGKNTLLPYLLSHNTMSIDLMIISHFDSDHCQGLLFIMNKLKVRNVIIGKQYEHSSNYQEFLKIIKEKKIKLSVVETGQRINIEKNLYFDILWPSSNKIISDNAINNNSLVCKLIYKNISMLFTGDIEEIAEKSIIEEYKNSNILNSNILKVAHHGSKSSSIEEFLEKVKPKIALIGVGANNTFGHPNMDIIERLKRMWK